MKPTTLVLICLLALMLLSCQSEKKEKAAIPPNIIYILADDLGYGDLSYNGQEKFQTPNIDALAANGMKFTQHYSGSTVCAPSRSVLMTGLHTGHTYIRGNKEVLPEGQHPLAASIITLAERFQAQGYKTGAFGKWGLGFPGSEGDPTKQGFDRFYGYNCQRIGHNYYPYALWSDTDSVLLKGNEGDKEGAYAPDLIHEQTLKFIEQNKDQPFFAFVPSIIPHAELRAPEAKVAKYRGKFLPEKIYEGCDADCKDYKIGGYGTQTECHAVFAAMIDLLDEQVGEIVAKIEELGLSENTLIIFTSDNGPHIEGGADPDYFNSNGIYRGYKRDLYEGGIRVPMIANWKGKIKAGSSTDHISAFWDIMPTFMETIGGEVPADIDGISFLPTLIGKGNQAKHDHLYWEFNERGGRKAVRKGDWKLVLYDVKKENPKPAELYNLVIDPSETNNVASQETAKVAALMQVLDTRADAVINQWNFARKN